MNQSKIIQLLDWTYDKALTGLPGVESVFELANDYRKQSTSLNDQINSLIRWQVGKCSTSGFVSGLGGVMTMPVAIPANISSVLYVQVRMIAAIAHMCGHNVKSDQVKSLVYMCLVGNGAKEICKQVGIKLGSQLTKTMIKNISTKAIIEINKKVGFRLLTKFGEKGVINLGKGIPLIGGIIGGTVDGISTNMVGDTAKECFM